MIRAALRLTDRMLRPILAALALLSLLAGCAAPGVQSSGGTLAVEQKAVAGEGYLLLKVQNARPVSVLNPKWKSVRLQPKGTGQVIELYDISDPTAAASLFYARLPKGEYEITEVASLGPGPGLLLAFIASDFQDLRERSGTFAVREGGIANLGTLVVARPSRKEARFKVELLRDALGRASAREDLQLRTAQALTLQENDGWLRPETPQQAEAARARARASISNLSYGIDAMSASVIGGTALGQILVREASGRWRSEPLDTLAPVTYARRLADGTLLAGSDQGRYFTRSPGGAWRASSLPVRSAVVSHIEPLSGGALLVVAQGLREVFVYHVSQPGAQARLVTTLDPPQMPLPGAILSTPRALVIPANQVGFTREVILFSIDKASFAVSRRTEKFLVFAFQRLRSGEVVADRFNSMSHYVSVSKDDGLTWQHGQAEGPLFPYFLDAQRGYGLDFSRGMFSVESTLAKTTDGGKSWQRVGAPVTLEFAGRVLGAGPSGEIVATMGWEVFSSRDEGRTWQRELPPPD
jgi:hypothetical protein